MNRSTSGEDASFNVTQHDWNIVVVSFDDGHSYSFDATRFAVAFQHRIRTKIGRDGLPTMEMLSKPAPYTELLLGAADRLADTAIRLPNIATRHTYRVGIMSQTNTTEEDLPPGLLQILNRAGGAWPGAVHDLAFSVTTTIRDSSAGIDTCIHQINRSTTGDKLVTLSFDWQRTFHQQRLVSKDSLKEILGSAQKAALAYFEELGEGVGFDV